MDAAETGAYLLWKTGLRLCAVPLDHVSGTMRPLPIEPLVDLPPFVLGLAIIRGSPVPVLDVGRLLGASCPSPSRFVTVLSGGRVVALAVDAVLGVRSLPRDAIAASPALLGRAGTELISAVGALDGDLLLVLQTARLVPEAIWSGLDAARASA